MKYDLAIILTLLLAANIFAANFDRGEYSERLFEQAQAAIEQSKKLRKEIAEQADFSPNYRTISNEDKGPWEEEMDQIIDD